MSVVLNDERFSSETHSLLSAKKKRSLCITNISLKSRTCLSRQLTKK